MTTIRVLHVAPTAFGADGLFGGGERYPLELARAIARLGEVDCELVTFGPRRGRFEDENGLRVRVVEPRTYLHGHPAHPVAPALLTALGDADVIHTHHMRSTPSRMVALVGRARRRRVVVTDHGLNGSDWLGVLPRLFHRLLAVSAYSASLLGVPPAKTRLIYGGADPDRFAPRTGTPRAGVLFVGRMTPHKGVDRLVRALPDNATLTVAGTVGHDPDPPERDYPEHVRELARDRDVHFVGAVDDAGLAELYRRAAVVAVPSVDVTCYGRAVSPSELLGLTTIEAMASAAPVVASRLGGLAEVVDDGRSGYLVQPGNVDELHDRLAQLLAAPDLAASMGTLGRERVLERFTWSAVARRCVEAYRELVS